MRTTLDIADDVLRAAEELAAREKKTAGQVISDLARKALVGNEAPAGAPESFLGFRPFPSRGRSVSNEMIDEIRQEEG